MYIGSDHHQTIGPDYIIVVSRPPLVPAPQFNASFLRTASGGTPPYLYTSSNRSIASVDPLSGNVVATGNGTARITVTDSVGRQAGYNITFTGSARLVRRRDDQFWSNSEPNPTPPEFHALTRAELHSLWLAYRGEDPTRSLPHILQWPNTLYWTSERDSNGGNPLAVDLRPLFPDFAGIRQDPNTRLPSFSRWAPP